MPRNPNFSPIINRNPDFENLSEIIFHLKNLSPPISFSSHSKFENNISNKIFPLLIENAQSNNYLDNFVSTVLSIQDRRIRTGDASSLPRSLTFPSERTGSPDGLVFLTHGLRAEVWPVTTYLSQDCVVDGRPVDFPGQTYTRVDFTPGGRASFDAAKLTDSLAQGIIGITEFLDAVAKGSFKSADILVGSTNLNMALIAQRLGFIIADSGRDPDGKIDKNKRMFTVVGHLADIKEKVAKFKAKGTLDKVVRRHGANPIPA